MNRAEIKNEAKEKIRGNKWNIWWPFLVIGVITSVIQSIFGGNVNIDVNNLENLTQINISTGQMFGLGITGIVSGLLTACYYKYILNFIRTGKFETNDIINTFKEKWLNILIAVVLVSIIVSIGFALFVIPGIVLSIAYTMATLLAVDTDISGSDALKKSREMMKGYKFDYFVFCLSFIGWFILLPFTLGILYIWLMPYLTVAELIYYDKLKTRLEIK